MLLKILSPERKRPVLQLTGFAVAAAGGVAELVVRLNHAGDFAQGVAAGVFLGGMLLALINTPRPKRR